MTRTPPPTVPPSSPLPPLDAAEFHQLRDLVHRHSGIRLFEHKRVLVQNRLNRRLRALGLLSFRAYLDLLRSGDANAPEFDRLIESICTHVTGFFREGAHFDYLRGPFVQEHRELPALRILSAGCSTGEEPYSIAMCLSDALSDGPGRRFQVQAFDLSASILRVAAAGIYAEERVRHLPRELVRRHFLKGHRQFSDKVRVAPELRRAVSFQKANLIRPRDLEGPFHAVFCRNVCIYFDRPTQLECFRWFHRVLAPRGLLFLGHSESLIGADQD
ncbi:MAG: CheR family methyltransferase, partial [Planctomycetota bacterium]